MSGLHDRGLLDSSPAELDILQGFFRSACLVAFMHVLQRPPSFFLSFLWSPTMFSPLESSKLLFFSRGKMLIFDANCPSAHSGAGVWLFSKKEKGL
jgi:hypothetical protein